MIFLDTGLLVAVVSQRDQYHEQARALWEQVHGVPCLTTNLVLVETANLLVRKIGAARAAEWTHILYRYSWLLVHQSSRDDEMQAIETLPRWGSHGVGLADAVSFIVMDRHGISQVATFDKHFKIAGYQSLNTSD